VKRKCVWAEALQSSFFVEKQLNCAFTDNKRESYAQSWDDGLFNAV
jgi:hypothetical protein